MSKKSKAKNTIIVILIVLVLVAAGAFLWFKFFKKTNVAGSNFGQMSSSSTSDMVTAYGVINIGTKEENLDIENMTASLQVEEILFATGDVINEGDELVRFSEDSVKEALTELEQTMKDAELEYRTGAIEYEQSLIKAKYTCQLTELKGEQADEVYNETIASLKSTLSDATETYNDAVAKLKEYRDASANNSYYTDYQVEYYKQVYDENEAILVKKMEEWDVSWQELSGRQINLGPDSTLKDQYIYVLQKLYSVLETNLRHYEDALEKYETAQAELAYNLADAEYGYSTVEETYQKAKKSYETSLLTAEETRQTTITNAELAQSEYEATVEKAKTDYESLLSKYEDAKEDYETFTSCVIDNVYHATDSGTVMRTMVRNEGSLSAGGRILTYTDPSDATVSVSVDQADIAKLNVGDTAICYSESTGMLNGTIVSISPVTQSTSISSVSYSVTVKLYNENESLSANTTVTVIFGADMSSLTGMDMSSFSSSNTQGEGGFSFDMSNMPDMGNFDMSNRPSMPGGFN